MTNKFRERAVSDTWYDLQPKYSSQKSFYGKAEVEVCCDERIKVYNLYSYKKNVARVVIVGETINAFSFGRFSNTTTRHQKEFFLQFGYEEDEVKMVLKNPLTTEEEINRIGF